MLADLDRVTGKMPGRDWRKGTGFQPKPKRARKSAPAAEDA